ncbi:MAG: histidine kinase [Bryobacteraceae bacterium]
MPAKRAPDPRDPHPGHAEALGLLRALLRRERAMVSSVLHDEIGQLLTAAGLELELARLDALARGGPEAAKPISAASRRMEEAFARVRALSYRTHPDPAAKFGFAYALDRYLEAAKIKHGSRLRTRIDRSAEPRNNLARAIYEIVTTTLDIALEEPYSSQVSFSTHVRSNGLRLRIRWTSKGSGGDPEGTEKEQIGVLEAIRQIAFSCGIPGTVYCDRTCASIVELHG